MLQPKQIHNEKNDKRDENDFENEFGSPDSSPKLPLAAADVQSEYQIKPVMMASPFQKSKYPSFAKDLTPSSFKDVNVKNSAFSEY